MQGALKGVGSTGAASMPFENVDYIGAEPAALIDIEAQHAQLQQRSTQKRHFYGCAQHCFWQPMNQQRALPRVCTST